MDQHEMETLLGELIMPRLDIQSYLSDVQYAEVTRHLVQNQMVGGFCIFGGGAVDVASVVIELQGIATTIGSSPLLFSCDCEFGLPMRLTEGGTEFPDAMAIAKTREPELAFKTGQAIAREMRALGISWNFAPVADVNSNPRNPIINTRSFGENPDTVAEFASAFMLGLQSKGVAASAKHFPGHGDTSVDSHRELPIIERDFESFDMLELPPFQTLIKDSVWSVMTGHLAAPQLAVHFGASTESQNLPATLSPALTTTLLREQLGFDGVIVTDALEMRAITEHFGADEAALLAFEAGADVLLMPTNSVSTFNALSNAIEAGMISSDDVRRRVDRIRNLKEKTRVDIFSIQPERLAEYASEHLRLANEIARKAMETVGKINLNGANMVVLTDDRPNAMNKSKIFETLLKPFVLEVKMFTPANWSQEGMEIGMDTILVTFHRARGYVSPLNESISVPSVIRAMATLFSDKGIAPRGMILFGSPYLDAEFKVLPEFVMKTFSESNASIAAVAEILKQ
jgi:beta-N-acetylhexosaminidase